MRVLDIKSKCPVLIPTNDNKNPFVILVSDGDVQEYWLVKQDGTLTGDGFYKEELSKYCPNLVL